MTKELITKTLPIVDRIIWFMFLILVASVSFIQSVYGSSEWYFISFYVFSLSGLALLRVALPLLQKSYNLNGLVNAKVVLSVFLLSLVWLFLQTVIPYESALFELFTSSDYSPVIVQDWFKPKVVLSVMPDLTMNLFWAELTMLMVLFLTIVLVSNRQRLNQLLLLILFIGVFHATVGIISKYSSIILVDRLQIDGHFTAARAWFVNRNHFASFISITMMAALTFQIKWLTSYKGKNYLNFFISQLLSYRVATLVALIISFMAILLSQSRAGFFAILFAFFCVVVWFGRNAKMQGKRRLLLLSMSAVALFATFYFGSDLLSRLQSKEPLFGERLPQWQLTWMIIKQEWLLGFGGNSYTTVFQSLREKNDFREVIYNQAHNDFLHIWLEQGLVGLILWFSFVVLALKQAFVSYSRTASTFTSAVMVAASIVILAALLQSLVGFNLQILNIRLYFFVIIGLIFAVPKIQHRKSKHKP